MKAFHGHLPGPFLLNYWPDILIHAPFPSRLPATIFSLLCNLNLEKIFAERRCEDRRYGLLEGGYNFTDLGEDVLAFCEELRGR